MIMGGRAKKAFVFDLFLITMLILISFIKDLSIYIKFGSVAYAVLYLLAVFLLLKVFNNDKKI